ncbi:MAG TPA: dethiobiotin synthase [Rickettsiales bacterium]|nr:dethiobiotin synthase [Rickettsiales bacterium]
MSCKRYFITATGTGIGKTFITAALTRQLRSRGASVVALKPVISGFDPAKLEESDTGILLKAQGLPLSQANAHAISPWQFSAPISPDMAAEAEKRPVDLKELIAFCRNNERQDYLLIEGVGGVMTPIGGDYTVLDWMTALGYEAIIVTGSYLGTLSHTLTACHCITGRGMPIHSLIISESETSPVPTARTLLTLKRFLPNNLPLYCVNRNDTTALPAEMTL